MQTYSSATHSVLIATALCTQNLYVGVQAPVKLHFPPYRTFSNTVAADGVVGQTMNSHYLKLIPEEPKT